MADAIKMVLDYKQRENESNGLRAIMMKREIQNNKKNIIMSEDKKTSKKKEAKPAEGKPVTPRKIVKLTRYKELVRDPFGLEL